MRDQWLAFSVSWQNWCQIICCLHGFKWFQCDNGVCVVNKYSSHTGFVSLCGLHYSRHIPPRQTERYNYMYFIGIKIVSVRYKVSLATNHLSGVKNVKNICHICTKTLKCILGCLMRSITFFLYNHFIDNSKAKKTFGTCFMIYTFVYKVDLYNYVMCWSIGANIIPHKMEVPEHNIC